MAEITLLLLPMGIISIKFTEILLVKKNTPDITLEIEENEKIILHQDGTLILK
ncbi:hypothetical protein [Chryseobacterium sp. YIM B08800]|uniref:hypothetical protein n=1 Tax=Chryseobacterium sp. YIM B08800 TaxID=2984136 RepID=UPI00223FB5E3|nr:hypothetical protein [Chryseobacterium sp. YIM B08800]